jgi:hypothetical protein
MADISRRISVISDGVSIKSLSISAGFNTSFIPVAKMHDLMREDYLPDKSSETTSSIIRAVSFRFAGVSKIHLSQHVYGWGSFARTV